MVKIGERFAADRIVDLARRAMRIIRQSLSLCCSTFRHRPGRHRPGQSSNCGGCDAFRHLCGRRQFTPPPSRPGRHGVIATAITTVRNNELSGEFERVRISRELQNWRALEHRNLLRRAFPAPCSLCREFRHSNCPTSCARRAPAAGRRHTQSPLLERCAALAMPTATLPPTAEYPAGGNDPGC